MTVAGLTRAKYKIYFYFERVEKLQAVLKKPYLTCKKVSVLNGYNTFQIQKLSKKFSDLKNKSLFASSFRNA